MFAGHEELVAADVIYFGTKDGTLYALDATSGAVLYEARFQKPLSTPAVVNGRIYLASSDGLRARSHALNVRLRSKLVSPWEHYVGESRPFS